MESLLQVLHILPLALILFLGVINMLKPVRKISSKVLFLCSLGILAGNMTHHNEIMGLFDPCFGYAVVLITIAVQLTRLDLAVKRNR